MGKQRESSAEKLPWENPACPCIVHRLTGPAKLRRIEPGTQAEPKSPISPTDDRPFPLPPIPQERDYQFADRMRILLDEDQLQAGVERLATEIDRFYGDQRPLTVIAVMTGSIVLFADLIRRLSMPQRVGVIQASSYRGGTESGQLEVDSTMLIDVKGRDVLLVDDIFDTGRTLDRLTRLIKDLGAKTTKTAVLLHKHRQHEVSLRPDFVAFEIPDEFVVGYGLDYMDMYRNLPYLAVLEESEIASTEHESKR